MPKTAMPVTRCLADLALGAPDEAGYLIQDIYTRKPPDYVIYRTVQRVSMQFADLPAKAAEQRKAMAALSPMRGKVNSLIDGWRTKKPGSKDRRRSEAFDRRVADSLVVALEGDVETAKKLLREVKQDILDLRVALARLQYLLVAFLFGAASGLAIVFCNVWFGGGSLPPVAKDLVWASGAGLVGAFFSIALSVRKRTMLPDLQFTSNALDAVLRMVIGLIAAVVLMAMVDAHLVNITFGERVDFARPQDTPAAGRAGAADPNAQAPVQPVLADAGTLWLQILITGFAAGFSEQFVPDLLSRVGATTPPQDPPGAPPGDTPPPKGPGDAPKDANPPEDKPKPGRSPRQDDDPADHDPDAHDDDCACDEALDEDRATRDEHLPAASGGVALADPARP